MENQQLRSIFERFNNLNLLNLRESLKRRTAAYGSWFDGFGWCPLAHGWASCVKDEPDESYDTAAMLAAGLQDHELSLGRSFYDWWDEPSIGWLERRARAAQLLRVLDEIWRVRANEAEKAQTALERRAAARRKRMLARAERRFHAAHAGYERV